MRYFDRHRKRLTKHHYIRGTLKSVSGEHEVKIEDSAGVPFNNVEIAGNTSQKQYQGYQLIPLKDGSFSETDSDGNVLSWEIKDGIVTVNGKWNKFRVLSLDYKKYNQAYYEAGEYTYTTAYYQGEGFEARGLGCDWKFNCFDEAGAQTNTTGWTDTKTRTVETQTFAHRFRIQHIQVYINGNTKYTNLRYAPALFKGAVTSTDIPPYEPYVGGIPSPNPGQVIHHYKDEEKETDISSMLSNSTCLTDQWGYVAAFDAPFIPDANATSVKFSVQSFYTGNINDMLLLAQNTGDLHSGINCITIACGDGTTSEIIIDPQEYPNGIYIGVGETNEGMQGNTDYYVQLAIGAGIIATETISILASTTEIPAYPQEIENANKEGMSVTLSGDNFREEIAIPTSVEVEGETVDLNMASISIVHSNGNTYTATDYLTVDRLSNKVLYHQNIGKMTLTSTNVVWSYEPTYKYFIFSTNIGSKKSYNPIISNKYIGFAHIGLMASKDYGITTDAQWWGVNNRITIRDIRFDNLTDFKADLDQNPLVIEYGLAEKIPHDITSTELGQALLRLCVDRGLEGTLRVESKLGISSLSCDYYSQENEDKVLLTVSYQNEAGDALMNDKTHNVRRGSKYQIVPPQIDGYEPSEKEVFGIADGDLTIILKYKEVSDVTV